ncbi:TPA: hypothetical protein ACT2IF_000787 [Streptococcus suis]|nr:hypothetical protein [Streptococcus suis]
MKIKSSLGNEAEDRTGVHQGKLTTDNFDFRRVLVYFLYLLQLSGRQFVVGDEANSVRLSAR